MGKTAELIRREVTQREPRHFHAHETARFDALSGMPLASFKQRAWAMCLDLLILTFLRGVMSVVGCGPHLHMPEGPITMAGLMVELWRWMKELVESAVYFGVMVKLGNGRTPGKYFMKARVVSLTHETMGWWQSIERALGYGASWLEGGFGFVQFFFARNQQCVHDRIAETIVIDERPSARRLQNEFSEAEDMVLP